MGIKLFSSTTFRRRLIVPNFSSPELFVADFSSPYFVPRTFLLAKTFRPKLFVSKPRRPHTFRRQLYISEIPKLKASAFRMKVGDEKR